MKRSRTGKRVASLAAKNMKKAPTKKARSRAASSLAKRKRSKKSSFFG